MMQTKPVYYSILSKSTSGTDDNVTYFLAPRTIQEFFTNGATFKKIPSYQRPYSWSDKNVKDLLLDIKKVSETDNGSWFFGPIFSVQKTLRDKYSDLLDGQQRITTIQILIREITFVLLENEGVSFEKHQELQSRINELIEDCKNCLIKSEGGKKYPIFVTEESIKETVNSYIIDFNNIKDKASLQKKRKDFKDKALKAKEDGSKTAGRIIEAQELIVNFLNNEFYNNSSLTIHKGLSKFCDFVESLLWKCWFLEVPLQKHEHSIQIFESLNNRGKPLTLVDKLRYKSLIKLQVTSDEDRAELFNKWKGIYSGLEFLEDNSYIKTEDDFFKVFFNAIEGNDFTKEEEFIEYYEKKYLHSNKAIYDFIVDTLRVIEFIQYVDTALDENNGFIAKIPRKEEYKTRALFQLFKRVIRISDNSRFLTFKLIIDNPSLIQSSNQICKGVWDIVRIVFYHEVFINNKSNKIRIDYLDYIRQVKSGNVKLGEVFEKSNDYLLENKSILNVIKTTDNDDAKFILFLYSFLTDYKSIISGSPVQYKFSELDHLWPKAWKNNWEANLYSKKELSDYLKSIDLKSYSHINLGMLIVEFEPLEDIELKKYTTAPFKQPNSLIEFIGNKWVLNSSVNVSTGNESFDFKKERYEDENYIKIPKNKDSLVGISKYKTFTYKDVVDRSLKIIDEIFSKIKRSWEDIE